MKSDPSMPPKSNVGIEAVDALFEKLSSGDRVSLARAITLMESRRTADFPAKERLIERCSALTPETLRIGISGLPGAGKSTFIERLGTELIRRNHKVAVLAVDPSSDRSGGSILGDKTRMDALSTNSAAFVRPSPNSGVLGGVTEVTRESIILCEAAGYDIVLIETVGVGQAEFGVHSMVDFFLLLSIPGAGDILQGIKRGIMEMADAVIVNKADGEQVKAAAQAASDIRSALRMTSRSSDHSEISVLTASALTGQGVNEAWDHIEERIQAFRTSGEFKKRRENQRTNWFENAVEYLLRSRITADLRLAELRAELISDVNSGKRHPVSAASTLVEAIRGKS